MIHVITEITEAGDDEEFRLRIEGFIKGDSTSTDREFQMAKAFMHRLTRLVKEAKEYAEKSGLEVKDFSQGGMSLKPTESEDA